MTRGLMLKTITVFSSTFCLLDSLSKPGNAPRRGRNMGLSVKCAVVTVFYADRYDSKKT